MNHLLFYRETRLPVKAGAKAEECPKGDLKEIKERKRNRSRVKAGAV